MNKFTTNKLNQIKVLLKTGQVSYEEATKMAEPVLQSMNRKIEVIAKKFKMKPKLVDFSNFMR